MANSGNAHEDGRDDDLHPPDPGHTSKNDRPATPAPPSSLALVLSVKDSAAAAVRTSPVKQGFRVGAAKKKQAPAAAARVVKPSTAANKRRRPPLSPTSTTAATLKGCNQNLRRSLGFIGEYTCLPTEEEWEFAKDVVERLRLFNDITVLFSGKDYVTANIYFTQIAAVRKKIKQWGTCGNPLVEAMSANMVTKFDKYWTDIQGLMGIATLLDPRFKTVVLLVCFEDLLGTTGQECEDRVQDVKTLLAELMREYHEEETVVNNESAPPSVGNSENFLSSLSARVASRMPANMGFKSELDRYLDEELLDMHTPNFKVLDWWKVAGTRFPTLRKIARDIFAIPVTTVASESAFSTSGRVLSEHRSRLTSKMLEALMCSQDWLRNKYKVDEKNKKAATFWSCLQDIQEGLQELNL